MQHLTNTGFWIALGEIVWINLLLSGDNAIVIALAARNLQGRQRRLAILGGGLGAISFRILLTFFALTLLELPYLKLVGSIALVWIGAKLLDRKPPHQPAAAHGLLRAIATILLADLVMSLDNVLAVAAAAQSGPEASRFVLLVAGLGLSIPPILLGSTALVAVMNRFPVVVMVGAAILGFVAGEMLFGDPVVVAWLAPDATTKLAGGVAGAVVVLAIGILWPRLRKSVGTS